MAKSDNPLFRQPAPISTALSNRVVALERENRNIRERVAELERLRRQDRDDYEAHINSGRVGGMVFSALLIGAIAWLAFGGRF